MDLALLLGAQRFLPRLVDLELRSKTLCYSRGQDISAILGTRLRFMVHRVNMNGRWTWLEVCCSQRASNPTDNFIFQRQSLRVLKCLINDPRNEILDARLIFGGVGARVGQRKRVSVPWWPCL